jgi:hypothetical protein
MKFDVYASVAPCHGIATDFAGIEPVEALASWTEPNSIAASGAKIVLTRSRAASSIDG